MLTNIVNKSLLDSDFPFTFKFATLVPLRKKATLEKEQYRDVHPVSNLAYMYVGKLIEKVVVDQVNDHRDENNLHQLHQPAYRKNHSTETALVKIVKDILCAMDEKLCVALVMLDLSTAFDTVSHSTLLHHLEEDLGVSGSALLWLESNFSECTQAVNINGTLSIPRPPTTRMPQGSRIGPNEFPPITSPLFAIAVKHNVEIYMYVDDTQLFVPFRVEEYASVMVRLEACITDHEVRTWLSENHLRLNDEKTEFLFMGPKQLINNIEGSKTICIDDSIITASPCAKNIGAMLDSQLDTRTHVNDIVRASCYHLRNIGQYCPNITVEDGSALIHAFIFSNLDNMNSLLDGLPDCAG